MRLLLVTPDYPPMRGGIQLFCSRLVAHSRHSYEVVCIGAGNRDAAADHSARSAPSTASGAPKRAARTIRVPRLPSHAASVAALNAVGLARVISRRPDAVICGHIVGAPATLLAQQMLDTPAVQILYALELSARPRLARFATQRACASIAISAHTRQLALATGAPTQRLHVIHPGVDLPTIQSIPARRDCTNRRPTIITVARLEDRYKGFDVMLKSLPLVRTKVPDVQWVLVGEGSLRAELQSAAASLGVADSVMFMGAVDDATRDNLLNEADVFAMPSRLLQDGTGGEGFGIVYLEAGAHRLPCVAGNVGGAVDAIKDGETGLLVDPKDHIGVAAAITALLSDRELAKQLGEAGRRRAEAQTWKRMAEQVDELIEHVIAKHGAQGTPS